MKDFIRDEYEGMNVALEQVGLQELYLMREIQHPSGGITINIHPFPWSAVEFIPNGSEFQILSDIEEGMLAIMVWHDDTVSHGYVPYDTMLEMLHPHSSTSNHDDIPIDNVPIEAPPYHEEKKLEPKKEAPRGNNNKSHLETSLEEISRENSEMQEMQVPSLTELDAENQEKNEAGKKIYIDIYIDSNIEEGDPNNIIFIKLLTEIFNYTPEEAKKTADKITAKYGKVWVQKIPKIIASEDYKKKIRAFMPYHQYIVFAVGKDTENKDLSLLEAFLGKLISEEGDINHDAITASLREYKNFPGILTAKRDFKQLTGVYSDTFAKLDEKYLTLLIKKKRDSELEGQVSNYNNINLQKAQRKQAMLEEMNNFSGPTDEERIQEFKDDYNIPVSNEEIVDEYIRMREISGDLFSPIPSEEFFYRRLIHEEYSYLPDDIKELLENELKKSLQDDVFKQVNSALTPHMYEKYIDFQLENLRQSDEYQFIEYLKGVYGLYKKAMFDFRQRRSDIDYDVAGFWQSPDMAENNQFWISDNWKNGFGKSPEYKAIHKEFPDVPFNGYNSQQLIHELHQPISGQIALDLYFSAGKFSIEDAENQTGQDEKTLGATRLNKILYQESLIEKVGTNINKYLMATGAVSMQAVLFPHQGQPIGLSLYLEVIDEENVKIIDFSVPTEKPPTYSATGANTKEAILKALENFGNDSVYPYPPGEIVVFAPESEFGAYNRLSIQCDGKNFDKQASDILQQIGQVAGMLGLVVMFIPGGQAVGIGLMVLGSITSASGAALNIKDRMEHEVFEWDTETTFDIIDIASAGLVVGGSAIKQIKHASKLVPLANAGDEATEITATILVANNFMQEINSINQQYTDGIIDKQERDQRINLIIKQAAATGMFVLAGYSAGKAIEYKGAKKQKEKLDAYMSKTDQDFNINNKKAIAEYQKGSGDIKKLRDEFNSELEKLALSRDELKKSGALASGPPLQDLDKYSVYLYRQIKSGFYNVRAKYSEVKNTLKIAKLIDADPGLSAMLQKSWDDSRMAGYSPDDKARVKEYRERNPASTLSNRQIREYYRLGKELNLETGKFYTPGLTRIADIKAKPLSRYTGKLNDDAKTKLLLEMRDGAQKGMESTDMVLAPDDIKFYKYQVQKASYLLGEHRAHLYMKGLGAKRLWPPEGLDVLDFTSRPHEFDQVWEMPDGTIYIVEAKGGLSETTGMAEFNVDGERKLVEQGTREYMMGTAQKMAGKTETEVVGKKIQKAIITGKTEVKYIQIFQKINKKGNPYILRIKEFNIEE